MLRCRAQHPMYALVTCAERRGHMGAHFHSFYMKAWTNDNPLSPSVARFLAKRGVAKDMTNGR